MVRNWNFWTYSFPCDNIYCSKNDFKQYEKENAKEFLREPPVIAAELEAKIRANAKSLNEAMAAPRGEDD